VKLFGGSGIRWEANRPVKLLIIIVGPAPTEKSRKDVADDESWWHYDGWLWA
jgi:hypothetical protein